MGWQSLPAEEHLYMFTEQLSISSPFPGLSVFSGSGTISHSSCLFFPIPCFIVHSESYSCLLISMSTDAHSLAHDWHHRHHSSPWPVLADLCWSIGGWADAAADKIGHWVLSWVVMGKCCMALSVYFFMFVCQFFFSLPRSRRRPRYREVWSCKTVPRVPTRLGCVF